MSTIVHIDGGRPLPSVSARLAIAMILIACGAASGCGRAVLTVDDVVLLPERPTLFTAQLERKTPFGVRRSVEGATVSFWCGEECMGLALTDEDGRVHVTRSLPGGATPRIVEARAVVGRNHLRESGPIHLWDPDRVIVAVDVDKTLSDTDWEALLLDHVDTESRPLPGSVRALQELSNDYYLLYVTNRPTFLRAKTRRWLELHGYPKAPLVTAPDVKSLLHNRAGRKFALLVGYKRFLPNLLIGVGDKESDVAAYSAAGMLSIIVPSEPLTVSAANVVLLHNWDRVRRYFHVNADWLKNPTRLTAMVSGREAAVPTMSDNASR